MRENIKKIDKLDLDMNIYSLMGDGISHPALMSRLIDLQSKLNEIIDRINSLI